MQPNKAIPQTWLLALCFLLISNLTLSQEPARPSPGVKEVSKGIFVITKLGCNIGVIVGKEGLLIIDTGMSEYSAITDSVISIISGLPVKYVFNTHFHFDHVGGNRKLAENGAVILAHDSTRRWMTVEWDLPEIGGIKVPVTPPFSLEYLPMICFHDSLNVYFNDNVIRCKNYTKAHSGSDAICYMENANVLFTGDLFLPAGLPLLDKYKGGSIDGYISAVKKLYNLCDDKTIIIPGHGPVSNRQALLEYGAMLSIERERIVSLMNQGKTLDEIIFTEPLQGLRKSMDKMARAFVTMIYQELSGK